MNNLPLQLTYLLITSVARRTLDEKIGFGVVNPQSLIGEEVSFTSTLPVIGSWL